MFAGVLYSYLLCDVPERVSHGQPLGLHLPLCLNLVGSLQLLEYEGPHDAVAHHQGQEADVGEEEGGDGPVCRIIITLQNSNNVHLVTFRQESHLDTGVGSTALPLP